MRRRSHAHAHHAKFDFRYLLVRVLPPGDGLLPLLQAREHRRLRSPSLEVCLGAQVCGWDPDRTVSVRLSSDGTAVRFWYPKPLESGGGGSAECDEPESGDEGATGAAPPAASATPTIRCFGPFELPYAVDREDEREYAHVRLTELEDCRRKMLADGCINLRNSRDEWFAERRVQLSRGAGSVTLRLQWYEERRKWSATVPAVPPVLVTELDMVLLRDDVGDLRCRMPQDDQFWSALASAVEDAPELAGKPPRILLAQDKGRAGQRSAGIRVKANHRFLTLFTRKFAAARGLPLSVSYNGETPAYIDVPRGFFDLLRQMETVRQRAEKLDGRTFRSHDFVAFRKSVDPGIRSYSAGQVLREREDKGGSSYEIKEWSRKAERHCEVRDVRRLIDRGDLEIRHRGKWLPGQRDGLVVSARMWDDAVGEWNRLLVPRFVEAGRSEREQLRGLLRPMGVSADWWRARTSDVASEVSGPDAEGEQQTDTDSDIPAPPDGDWTLDEVMDAYRRLKPMKQTRAEDTDAGNGPDPKAAEVVDRVERLPWWAWEENRLW